MMKAKLHKSFLAVGFIFCSVSASADEAPLVSMKAVSEAHEEMISNATCSDLINALAFVDRNDPKAVEDVRVFGLVWYLHLTSISHINDEPMETTEERFSSFCLPDMTRRISDFR